jgi:hypothetical protein
VRGRILLENLGYSVVTDNQEELPMDKAIGRTRFVESIP